MSKFTLGADAGATASVGPATGWSRSVLPFTGLRLRRPSPRSFLPKAAGRRMARGTRLSAACLCAERARPLRFS